ncbi:hypothetical protein [Serratia sp. (in: enterobacteria)]|uniref:hypothetical protein n=1 Tax=Serratia sp. (in: enterobacteria) TaxID=616 RepID=UPI003988D761
MHLVGRDKLEDVKLADPAYRCWVNAWVSELIRAHWRSKEDIYEHFPKAVEVTDNVFLFKVENSSFSIETLFCFNQLAVIITSVKEN